MAALMEDILFSKLLTFLIFFSMNKILLRKVRNLFQGHFSFQHGIFKIQCFSDTKMLNLPWFYNIILTCLYDSPTKKQQLLGWNLGNTIEIIVCIFQNKLRATIHLHLPFRMLLTGFLLERTSCLVAFQG
jgi:hypothetical protein